MDRLVFRVSSRDDSGQSVISSPAAICSHQRGLTEVLSTFHNNHIPRLHHHTITINYLITCGWTVEDAFGLLLMYTSPSFSVTE